MKTCSSFIPFSRRPYRHFDAEATTASSLESVFRPKLMVYSIAVDRILNQHKIEKLARDAEAAQRTALLERADNQAVRKGSLNATASEKRTSSEADTQSVTKQSETSSDALSVRSKEGNKLIGPDFMNQLKGRFRRGSNGSTAGPMVPQSTNAQHPLGANQNKKEVSPVVYEAFEVSDLLSLQVTPFSSIKEGALRAIAASRPNASKSDIISEPAATMVKESADTYCDTSGVKTNLTQAGEHGPRSLVDILC